ncbi:hypothetical protein L7F22_054247 [Adiantum nelumboides]|nr:hypothetical protein [Adiantum nelumboides]
MNRTGSTWHIEVDGGTYDRYGYRCTGENSWEKGNRFHGRRILLDPYANTGTLPTWTSLPSPADALGSLSRDEMQFDWGDDLHLEIPLEELVVYRLNVTGFTADKCELHHSAADIFFQQEENSYYPLSFFAPMDCFGPEKTSASSGLSLKRAIKELHRNQIEVLLDVIFGHTGENSDEAPETLSFHGIDNATDYILD